MDLVSVDFYSLYKEVLALSTFLKYILKKDNWNTNRNEKWNVITIDIQSTGIRVRLRILIDKSYSETNPVSVCNV